MNEIAYKICLALTVIGFIYIRADRSTAANDLLGNGGFLFCPYKYVNKNNSEMENFLHLWLSIGILERIE